MRAAGEPDGGCSVERVSCHRVAAVAASGGTHVDLPVDPSVRLAVAVHGGLAEDARGVRQALPGRQLLARLALVLAVLSFCLAGAYTADHARDARASAAAAMGVQRSLVDAAPVGLQPAVTAEMAETAASSASSSPESHLTDPSVGSSVTDGGHDQGEDGSRGAHQHVEHDVLMDVAPRAGAPVNTAATITSRQAPPLVHAPIVLPPD